ncbi:hypothetical protein [Peredibacter starrii]|uniref:Uncharacterized protein n=1 Tax=Peredibacter starrii TaxID=28202 RepID=A0AAX4HMP9_9BACT|nr:hypothetical protein [Peredibacter starrii]WPU64564.1 hypothetical protein SOO65_17870 [Peredibacter starrii]
MNIFKLPVGLMLALSFFSTAVIPQGVQASVLEDYKMQFTSHEQQVAEAFDRFHFAMAVEWDQRDVAFKEEAQKKLEKTLLDLMKAGVTAQEIQRAMEKSILQGKAQADYKRLVEALKTQDVTEEQATQLAMEFMDKNYHEGTSFAGEGPHHGKWKVIAAIIIVVVIICCVKGLSRDHDDDKEEVDHHDCDYGYGRSGNYCYPIRD